MTCWSSEGLAGFTISEVARRSGASKVTIYKWWPSKGALALDCYFATVEPVLAFPDTGDMESDVRSQLHSFIELLTGTRAGQTVAELIGGAQGDPDLMAVVDPLWGARYHRCYCPISPSTRTS
ncbi:MAG: TetR/AcrR family transcriptional regulator [Ornithinimicrobium sp.]